MEHPADAGDLAPSLIWLIWRGRHLLKGRRFLVLLTSGFILGAFPWIVYNVRHDLASFHESLAAGTARGIGAVVSNFQYLITESLPELLASADPSRSLLRPPNAIQRILRVPVLVIYAAAFLFTAAQLTVSLLRRSPKSRENKPTVWLFLLVAAAVLAPNVFSEAGRKRGPTVRYILPLYFSAVALLGLFLKWVGRRLSGIAWSLLAIRPRLQCPGLRALVDTGKDPLARGLELDRQLMAVLRTNQIQAVCGNYWSSYPINFLSRETIVGIPDQLVVDHYRYAERLGDRPLRWALIAMNERHLHRWVNNTGLSGTFAHPAPEVFLFIPDPALCREVPRLFLNKILADLVRKG